MQRERRRSNADEALPIDPDLTELCPHCLEVVKRNVARFSRHLRTVVRRHVSKTVGTHGKGPAVANHDRRRYPQRIDKHRAAAVVAGQRLACGALPTCPERWIKAD